MSGAPKAKVEKQKLPPDALVIKELLKSMGVKDYEPRVIQQLLNFMYRHVADILQDAEAYKQRLGGSGEVGMEDLLVAIQSREAFNFVQTPPQNVLMDMAARRNKQPLPELSDKPGLTIPGNSLMGPAYQMSVTSDESLPAAGPEEGGGVPESGDSRPRSEREGTRGRIQINIPGNARGMGGS